MVLIPIVLVPCIAASYALSREDEYSAKASLLFRSAPGSDFNLSSVEDEERESATNVSLASLDQIAERTARALGGGVTAGTVAESVEVAADGSANLLTFTATNRDRKLAAPIANGYAREYIAFRREADRTAVGDSRQRTQRRLDAIQDQLTALTGRPLPAPGTPAGTRAINQVRTLRAERAQLLEESQRLGALGALSSGNVELAQRAETPGGPSSTGPLPIIGLGIGLGVLLGIALALLFQVFDRRLRDLDEIAAVFDRPTLGAIPTSPALDRNPRSRRKERRDGGSLGPGETEAFHMLRANLRYFEADRPIRSVVITSAAPGEGKSTVAWNLAAAAANAGSRVLLIEAELRRPTFVSEFRLEDTLGLTDILADGAHLNSVLQRLSAGKRTDNGDEPPSGMDVIVAGGVPPNPTDLLESRRAEELIRTAEEEYDLVVIDTPPVSVVADAIPLLKRADGVIVVVLLGTTSRDAAGHLRRQLEGLKANLLGVVVNGISSQDGYYGAASGYASGYQPVQVHGQTAG